MKISIVRNMGPVVPLVVSQLRAEFPTTVSAGNDIACIGPYLSHPEKTYRGFSDRATG